MKKYLPSIIIVIVLLICFFFTFSPNMEKKQTFQSVKKNTTNNNNKQENNTSKNEKIISQKNQNHFDVIQNQSTPKQNFVNSSKKDITPYQSTMVMTEERRIFEERIAKSDINTRKVTPPPLRKAKKGFEKDPKPQPQTDRPDLAREHEILLTADPATGLVPYEELQNARVQLKNYFRQKAAIPNVQWTERGPNNVGGRTRALMFDPNDATNKKVWAGSSSGGVWWTNDITTNSTWNKVNDFWATLGVSALAYLPTNTQVFYAGTGDSDAGVVNGAGIFKSTDGGNTWNQMSNTTSMTVVHDIKFRQVGATTEMYVGANNGLWRSVDGGDNFTQITLPNSVIPKDIEIAADNRIFIGSTSGGFILFSNTGNTGSWTVNDFVGARVEIAVAPSDANVIYAVASGGSGSNDVGFFKKSINKGVTWTDITIPMYLNQNCTVSTSHFTRGQAWYDLIMLVSPNNPNVVIVGGIDIHRSLDGGSTWNSVSYWTGGCRDYAHADQHGMTYRPNNPNEAIFGHDGGISYSSNIFNATSTPAFDDRVMNFNVTQYYAVALKNTTGSNYMLAGAQDNGSHRFLESGSQSVTRATGGDGAYCFIDQTDAVIQTTSYVYNAYYFSKNSGTNFSGSFGSGDAGMFINPTDFDNSSKIAYYSGNPNELRYTNVSATTPTENITSISINNVRISALQANNYTPNRVFIGTTGGRIYRIDNANTATPTLTNITGTINAGTIRSIDVGANDNELLVTLSNYNIRSVYYSNDGGANWVSKDEAGHGLLNIPIRWGIFNPNNRKQVMIATDLGVWSTNDITASNPGWEPTNQNLANVRCDMLKVRSSDKLVAVATHGRGVFTTLAFQNATPDFTTDKRITYTNTNVVFTNNSAQSTAWNWNFGAGATPVTANTQGAHNVQYSTEGKKSPSLTINNNPALSITKNDHLTILPNRNVSYNLANGGNFETNSDDFANEPLSSATFFARGNSTINGKNGTTSGNFAWVLNPNDAVYADMAEARLYTPNFNLSVNTTYTLSFKTKFAFEQNYDGVIVEYSIDKGISWLQLGASNLTANWYNGTKLNSGGFATGTNFFTGTSNGFENKSIDVSFLANNPNVAFRFVFKSDQSDNAAGIAIDDFTITALNAPAQLVSLNPLHLANNVNISTNLVMTFDKNMQKGTGNILIKKTSDNSVVQTIDVLSNLVNINNQIVTISQAGLAYNTEYYVEVSNTALKDIDNNNYAGFSGSTTWKFTTATNTPAVLVTLNPANMSTNVPINTNLILTFSRNMQKGTGNILIKKASDNTIVHTISILTNAVTINNEIVTIQQSGLENSTQYYVEIPNGALKDDGNNFYAGFLGDATWKFTTESQSVTPPVLNVGNIGSLDIGYNNNSNTQDFVILTGNSKFTNVKVNVFDMKGIVVKTFNANEVTNGTKLQMRDLPNATYIVKIETDQGSKTKKVLKLDW